MNRYEFENRIYNQVTSYFLKLLANTENFKVKCEITTIEGNSEIGIYVFRNSDLSDVFEFFVYYNGEPNVTEEEVLDYLNKIKEIII